MERDQDPRIDLNAGEDATRAAFRRRRALTAGLGAVAVLAVIGAGGVLIQSMRGTGGDQPTPPPAANPTDPRRPAPDTRNSAPDSELPASPKPPTGPPIISPTTLIDLRVRAATVVTLTTDGTVYRGSVKVTITNAGSPYGQTIVFVTQVDGVRIDWMAGDPGFGTCGGGGNDIVCNGPSVPSGGTAEKTVHFVADWAPLPSDKTITGVTLRYAAQPPIGGGVFIDATPADNHLEFTLVLKAAA
jgi:hypothetical protein